MALNSSGPISLGNICGEKGIPSSNVSLATLSTTNINSLSGSKPNGAAPHAISEFYNYNHAATAPSIVITAYSGGYLYFTLSGTGYSTSAITVRKSTSSSSGPWSNDTGSPLSPRNVGVPSTSTWYQIQDAITPSIVSNVFYVSTVDTTAPSVPGGLYCDYGSGLPQTSIAIYWSASTDNVGVAGYQLQRKTGGTTTWTTKYTGPNTSYQDGGVRNTLYNYQVRSFDAAGNYSNFSPIASWLTDGGVICFVEGTMITLPNGTQKPIETLALNELLLSSEIETLQDTNNVNELYKWSCDHLSETRITSPITKIEPKVANETIIINNGLLEATPYHSQLIQRDGIWKFIAIGEVIVGDNLYGIDKEIIPVTSVTINLEKRNIYPMSLSPSHTYFANGILTHNIKPQDPV